MFSINSTGYMFQALKFHLKIKCFKDWVWKIAKVFSFCSARTVRDVAIIKMHYAGIHMHFLINSIQMNFELVLCYGMLYHLILSTRCKWVGWYDHGAMNVKGSSDPSHFIFEIYVGKRRIRHRTTLNLNLQSSIDFESI